MIKVCKFGGSSLASSSQFEKVKNIILSDKRRKAVVVSAPGKRFKEDNKVTDLLYLLCAHLKYGVDYSSIFNIIKDRFIKIKEELNIDYDLERNLMN